MKPQSVNSFFDSTSGRWLWRANWWTERGYSSKTFESEAAAMNADYNAHFPGAK